jgi:hypothetical protein
MTENASWKLPQERRHWPSNETDIAFTPSSDFRCTASAFSTADTPSLPCPFKRKANAWKQNEQITTWKNGDKTLNYKIVQRVAGVAAELEVANGII